MVDVARRSPTASPPQRTATIVATTMLVVGTAGFVPGLVQDYGQLEFAGSDSTAELLGLFQVSILLNLIHLALGAVGLAMASRVNGADEFLVGGGVIYLLLWAYGIVVGPTGDANFVPFDMADNWLHFGIGVAMVVLGLGMASRCRSMTTY
jgi:Domain of unknown function (DUF4383)